MSNSIQATVTFSFKGETFSPSIRIDLDTFIREENDPSMIYNLLARSGGIDTYSYAYEVMEVCEIEYCEPAGLACNHLHDGKFDFQGFHADWLHHNNLEVVQKIAQKHLSIDDLEQHPQLRDALLEALNTSKLSV